MFIVLWRQAKHSHLDWKEDTWETADGELKDNTFFTTKEAAEIQIELEKKHDELNGDEYEYKIFEIKEVNND